MRRAEVIALVSARRDEIVQRFGVRSLSFFGWVARDEARPDSDVLTATGIKPRLGPFIDQDVVRVA